MRALLGAPDNIRTVELQRPLPEPDPKLRDRLLDREPLVAVERGKGRAHADVAGAVLDRRPCDLPEQPQVAADATGRNERQVSPMLLSELVDEYLNQHVAKANTIQALRDRLKLATDGIPVKPQRWNASTASGQSASIDWMLAPSRRGASVYPNRPP